MIALTTYFDRNYFTRGMALIYSLVRHLPVGGWHLYILALDDVTEHRLAGFRHAYPHLPLTVFPLEALETAALVRARQSRAWREYIFTLTPALVLYVLDYYALNSVAYLDADCYLYGDLAPLYEEVKEAEIAVIPHRWTPRLASKLRVSGLFNVGWVYWRATPAAETCLRRWQQECLGWTPDGHRPFSDQIYLDTWPDRYGDVLHQVAHAGANLAPWNQEQYRYDFCDDRLWIEFSDHCEPVLFYHFHNLQPVQHSTYYLVKPVIEHLYKPYEVELATLQALTEHSL